MAGLDQHVQHGRSIHHAPTYLQDLLLRLAATDIANRSYAAQTARSTYDSAQSLLVPPATRKQLQSLLSTETDKLHDRANVVFSWLPVRNCGVFRRCGACNHVLPFPLVSRSLCDPSFSTFWCFSRAIYAASYLPSGLPCFLQVYRNGSVISVALTDVVTMTPSQASPLAPCPQETLPSTSAVLHLSEARRVATNLLDNGDVLQLRLVPNGLDSAATLELAHSLHRCVLSNFQLHVRKEKKKQTRAWWECYTA